MRRDARGSLRPADARGVGPQLFEGVVLARARVENVHDHVAVILYHPAARLVPLDGQPTVTRPRQGGVDFLGEGMNLATAGAGDENEVVVQTGDAAHVKD